MLRRVINVPHSAAMTPDDTPRPDPGPTMLTADQLVERLQVSRPTLYRLIKRGDFPPPVKVGGCSRWPATDLDEFIMASRGDSES